jgi:hypothetical protein
MKFLKLKKNKHSINIKFDLTSILNDPLLGNENNLDNFKTAFEDSIKYYAEKFSRPNSDVNFGTGNSSFSIQFDNDNLLQDYISILDSINNNSKRIYKRLVDSGNIITTSNLNTFIEHFYASLFKEIIEYNKTLDLKFLEIETTPFSLKVSTNLKEINFIDPSIGNNYNMCFTECVTKQFNDYAKTYHPNEDLFISVLYKELQYLVITSNNNNTITYLANICEKLNNQSNKIYEIAINDIHLSYFEKEDSLTEQFSKLINGFISKEVMEQHLPSNNTSTGKRLKI